MSFKDEKSGDISQFPVADVQEAYSDELKEENQFEVFKKSEDVVDFRTVGWIRASIIFIKVQFALGVLNIPNAMYDVGALPGSLLVVGWGIFNTYSAILYGDFRNRHAGMHSAADMAGLVGGPWLKELTGGLFIIGNVLCVSTSIVALSTALNAVSHHAACTVWWSFISMIAVAGGASLRKFHAIGWVTWAGFISIFSAVFIVVVAVTTRDRPAAAPQTGPYDLGYQVIASPDFITGMTASTTIFVSAAGASMFPQVVAEMRNPKDFNKAIALCMFIVNGSYLSFSLVVYAWCGKWVASPSLGSAGGTIKIVSYAIAIIGLLASAIVYLHLGSKYLFVRMLRNSRHLQANTVVHWTVWLGTTFGLCILAFILAEAIPILNYLLALMGSICFTPLSIMLPPLLWMHDFGWWRKASILKQLAWAGFVLMFVVGAFLTVGGTYSTIQLIINAYADGTIGGAFECADNSNSS